MKLLVVSDLVLQTGFARVTEALLPFWREAGHDIAVLALNYAGHPTPLQHHHRLYPAMLGGDAYGYGLIEQVVRQEQPDVIWILNDLPVVAAYLARLPEAERRRVVCYSPVDSEGLDPLLGPALADVAITTYTRFGARQIATAGIREDVPVIPHGIDLAQFASVEQRAARRKAQLPQDVPIVLLLDRNQPRKRLDLALKAFALVARTHPDAILVYHGAVQDAGYPLDKIARALGIERRVRFNPTLRPGRGAPLSDLPAIYSAADIKLSTTSGEGWGLTTMEAMACSVCNLVPDWAALGEWPRGGAAYVDAPIEEGHLYDGQFGRVPLISDTARVLIGLLDSPAIRQHTAQVGRALVADPIYRWEGIAAQHLRIIEQRGAEVGR